MMKKLIKSATTQRFRWKLQLHVGRFLQRAERWLGRDPKTSRSVLVSFSYLFRDVSDYVDAIRDDYSQRGEPIRILCAGCATGQEPYSIAIVCHDLAIPVSIVGIDLSANAIQTAAAGKYDLEHEKRRSADEDTTAAAEYIDHFSAYFAPVDDSGGLREVRSDIRKLIRFEVADICNLPFQPEFDFVVCRKMLYYLARADQVRALKSLRSVLKADRSESHLILDGHTRRQPEFRAVFEEALGGEDAVPFVTP
jgi:chemotaxis methyl-accepting protein methylase